jgi:hypothetical protein
MIAGCAREESEWSSRTMIKSEGGGDMISESITT